MEPNQKDTIEMFSHRRAAHVVIAVALLALAAAPVTAKNYRDWSAPQSLESLPGSSSDVNTSAMEGCPIQSPDGLSLYMASTRSGPGGQGGIDIWVAHRPSTDVGFGTPVNLGAPINSDANDFCPTPVRGKGLFFVSTRAGGCAANTADMYFARHNPAHGWTQPVHLGCTVNSAADEFSPSYVEENGAGALYFSSSRAGTHDIYRSVEQPDGSFGAAQPVAGLNSANGDFRPNISKAGLEIYFDSDRNASPGVTDIYVARRASVDAPWADPVNLAAINSPAGESRASLSWDGTMLLFGSTRAGEGSSDIYFATR